MKTFRKKKIFKIFALSHPIFTFDGGLFYGFMVGIVLAKNSTLGTILK